MAEASLKLGFLALLLLISTGLPNVMSELSPCVTEDDCLAPCGRPSGCTGQRQDGTPGCVCSAAAGAATNVTKDLPPCVTEDDCVAPCGGPAGCTGQRKDGNPGCICKAGVQTPQPAANTATTKSADLPPCVTEDDCVAPCGGPAGCTGQRKDGNPGCICKAAEVKQRGRTRAHAATKRSSKAGNKRRSSKAGKKRRGSRRDLPPCVTEDDCLVACGRPAACAGQRKDGTPGCVCKVAEVKQRSSTRAHAATKRSSKAGNNRRSSKAGQKRRASHRDLPPCVTEDDCLVACGRPAACAGQRKDGTPGCVCKNHRNKSN